MSMNTVITFYRLLLCLYPASFRESFANEMQDTFADLLRERQAQGRGSMLLAARETAILPLLALHEHIDERLTSMNQTTTTNNAVPHVLRAVGIITTLFLLVCSLIVWLQFLALPSGADVSKLVLMIAVFHAVMLVSLLIAFRFPAYGSVVVIASAATLAVIQFALLSGIAVGVASALLVGLWAAPYIGLGIAIRLQQPRHAFAA
jgi:hypothetical protein